GPPTYAVADSGTYNWFPGVHARTDFSRPDGRYGPNGVVYRRSETRMADVAQKGTSNTYMIGEKFLRADKYTPPACPSCSDGGGKKGVHVPGPQQRRRAGAVLPARARPSTAVPVSGCEPLERRCTSGQQ